MLQIRTVTPDTLELLKRLQDMPELAETRLVGGTALALMLGHRLSIDLDLFGKINSEILTETLRAEGFDTFDVYFENKVIKHYFINQVKVDVVKYDHYPWIENMIVEDGIRLAGMKDIAAMKLGAITNRGSRKDFVDLYFLLKTFSMQEVFGFYTEKYPDSTPFLTFRSLVYFDDADKEDMPDMLIPTTWEEVKTHIASEVKKL